MIAQLIHRHAAAVSAMVVFVAFAVAGTVIVGQGDPRHHGRGLRVGRVRRGRLRATNKHPHEDADSHPHPYAHAHSHAYPDAHGYPNAHAYVHAYANEPTQANDHTHVHGHRDGHGHANAHGHPYQYSYRRYRWRGRRRRRGRDRRHIWPKSRTARHSVAVTSGQTTRLPLVESGMDTQLSLRRVPNRMAESGCG